MRAMVSFSNDSAQSKTMLVLKHFQKKLLIYFLRIQDMLRKCPNK